MVTQTGDVFPPSEDKLTTTPEFLSAKNSEGKSSPSKRLGQSSFSMEQVLRTLALPGSRFAASAILFRKATFA